MGFNEFMTKLFGNKSQRDLKEITPYVDKIKAVYPSIQKLSNDELRAKTDEIKQRIQDYVADERAKVEELRKGIDNKELEEREAIWAEVDKIEKNITEKMEVVLEEVLPEVFSIMKDTAPRFSENEIRLCGNQRRQGHLSQPLGSRWQRNHLGYGPLRRTVVRWCRTAQRQDCRNGDR